MSGQSEDSQPSARASGPLDFLSGLTPSAIKQLGVVVLRPDEIEMFATVSKALGGDRDAEELFTQGDPDLVKALKEGQESAGSEARGWALAIGTFVAEKPEVIRDLILAVSITEGLKKFCNELLDDRTAAHERCSQLPADLRSGVCAVIDGAASIFGILLFCLLGAIQNHSLATSAALEKSIALLRQSVASLKACIPSVRHELSAASNQIISLGTRKFPNAHVGMLWIGREVLDAITLSQHGDGRMILASSPGGLFNARIADVSECAALASALVRLPIKDATELMTTAEQEASRAAVNRGLMASATAVRGGFQAKAASESRDLLTEKERTILEALGSQTLTGQAMAIKAGYPFNSAFRNVLSNMVKRGILAKVKDGYRAILNVTDNVTDTT